MTMRALLSSLLLSLCILMPTWLRAESRLRVEGTRFIIAEADGKLRSGTDLIGAELDLGEVGVVRVLGVERDLSARFKEVWLYTLLLREPGALQFSAFCAPDIKGDTRVLVYPGYFDTQRRYVSDRDRFSISCVNGVEAKCLRWGYLPWRKAPLTGESLAPYFDSCINLARADYCASDQPVTRDGTTIDVYDHVGVQQREPGVDTLSFEAGWNVNGAVCVHHTRIPENLQLTELPGRCPRFTKDLRGALCTESSAKQQGAILFNRSRDSAR